ncbi:DNA topoisomerase 2-binding protein 1 [Lethenteron reissneri]|uniref:DNA topoisomerase 2-binding protein 1 n=1 Tax=Lethenteron reissneri TaxID=7753 RepID=UPI002AB6F70C|nr:DNA topoisomerase 2-binding protein 1 [Lethenteron reissneri]XP_061413502.1 DNA topoisomerase 2-binding protein 1 [Lethenteron reissneri]XP_061413503.1 DNA topoisomerase 2-binding protein 1 [Lethenteron reissneri]XP_061413504.1 DNA topoisomerase 2-binding protein 1 [Lethenteron reissneri]XP_061413506.1 DNA topoisomerase 2-binding protein 1 [Lethenteron reissneri]
MTKRSAEKLFVKFVEDNENESKYFKEAYEKICKIQSESLLQRVDVAKVLTLKEIDRSLYVCDPFHGVAFDHLVKMGCRVVGPQVVLFCLDRERCVPKAEHPVYNMALADAVLSCTNIDKDVREEMHRLIGLMGGRVLRDFTSAVTHLVAGEVGSKKYLVAASLKKPIMLVSWITTCWEASQERMVCGTDNEWLEKHMCPPLQGCMLSVTGLSTQERRDIQRLVTKHGGTYSGELKMNECTHLIVHKPQGQKYEFARKWNVACVTVQWLHDSVERGACQDEGLYAVLPLDDMGGGPQEPSTSTPSPSRGRPGSCAMSNVSSISNISMSRINETVSATSMATRLEVTAVGARAEVNELDSLDPAHLYGLDSLLDGCKIFVCGFSGKRLEKLRRLVNLGGGVRYNQNSADVTHIIVGDRDRERDLTVGQENSMRNVVTAKWLVDCFTQRRLLPTDLYLHPDYTAPEEILLQAPLAPVASVPSQQRVPPLTEQGPAGRGRGIRSNAGDGMERADDELMLQYSQPTDGMVSRNATDRTYTEESHTNTTISNATPSTRLLASIDTKGDSTLCEDSGAGIFSGKRFAVVGFSANEESELALLVSEHGGKMLPTNSRAVAHYAVVPLLGCEVENTVHEVVTNTWLVMCVEQQQLLELNSNPLFTPVPVLEGHYPLSACVLSISQFTGTERDSLIFLAETLGARVQEFFVRKANPKKNMHASTHLLVREASGCKFEAANKWDLPAVGVGWLLESARKGRRAKEHGHTVRLAQTTEPGTPVNAGQCREQEMPNAAPVVDTAHTPTDASLALESKFVTPLDYNRFRSKTFQNVLAAERGGTASSEAVAAKDPKVGAAVGKAASDKDTARKVAGGGSGSEAPQDTPSKFLCRDKLIKPCFDVKDSLKALESPEGGQGAADRSASGTPLSQLFRNNLNVALANSTRPVDPASPELPKAVQREQKETTSILSGVVICVSKKLSKRQAELNSIAASLGAEYRWSFDEEVTHFVYQGRAHDNSQEYRVVRDRGIHVVSEHWLHACAQEQKHVAETLYPHSYNPSLSLDLSAVQQPQRVTRTLRQHPGSCAVNSQDLDTDDEDEYIAQHGKQSNQQYEQSKDTSIRKNDALATLELRENLQQQLQEIMMATKAGAIGPSRLGTNSPQPQQDANSGVMRSGRISRSRTWDNVRSSPAPLDTHSEQSQGDQITWDDPTAREERARLATQLHCGAMNSTPGPTSGPPPNHIPTSSTAKQQPPLVQPALANVEKSKQEVPEQAVKLPTGPDSTPQAPSIAFPLANPPVAPQPPETVSGGHEGDAIQPHRYFQLSSMSAQERIDYLQLIEQLGGVVLDKQYFDPSCSHIIVGNPLRNEKYLASMAAGKWVLHKSYLEACRSMGRFVQEEEYEWGSSHILDALANLSTQQRRLAAAAMRWRKKLQLQRRQEPGAQVGAFGGWKVILNIEQSKESGFRRLLQSGGAEVLSSGEAQALEEATHLFVDAARLRSEEVRTGLLQAAARHVHCLRPEYIADFLIMDSPPTLEQYYIPDVPAPQAGEESGPSTARKRKATDSALKEKRSRLQ